MTREVMIVRKMLASKSKLSYASVLMIIFYVALGCNVDKRLQKAEILLAEKGKLPEICAVRFPLRDSIVYRDTVKYDTLYEGIYSVDTVYDRDTVKVFLTLPAKIITKEVIKYRDVYRENTSKVVDCQNKNEELVKNLVKFEEERTKLLKELGSWKSVAKQRWWFLWILLVIALAIIFRKNIIRLAGNLVGLKPW